MAALLIAAPLVLATLAVLAFAGLEVQGRTPLSYPPPRNVAEAAGMGHGPEVLRFLRSGQDATVILDVRPHIISSSVTRVSALEAAVWSRRAQLMRLLDREGAIPAGVRAHLACLAADLGTAEVVDYLAATESARCEPGGTARRIAARSEVE